MTSVRLPLVRLLAAACFALLCLMIPMDAGAQATTPGAPTIDKITARAGWLLVEWSAPTSDGGSAITAYDVRYIETDATDKADANWDVTHDVWTATNVNELHYALRNLTNDTEYDVQVRAVNANGDGEWSTTFAAKPEFSADTVPTVTLRADDGAVAVTWKPPNVVVDPITGYDVQYREDGGNWEDVDPPWAGGRLEYGITGLTNDTEYDVQVRAVDSFGDGTWSETMSETPADFGDSDTAATDVTLQTAPSGRLVPLGSLRYWGNIGSETDVDWFKLEITRTQAPAPVGFWIYTVGDLDSVGELFESDGTELTPLEKDDYGGVLPDPENFFIWRTLSAGTYYIKISGYDSETGDYVFRVRTFTDTTSRSNTTDLRVGGSASGMIDPDSDDDYFRLVLGGRTDVILRSSGFPDTEGTLLNSGGGEIAYNDDGLLVPGRRHFLIRRLLDAGTYYLKVGSFLDWTDGPFSVYATAATDPGDSLADAAPLTLGDAAGGNITASDDEDYFKIEVDETTYVRIWTSTQPDDVDTDGELLDSDGNTITNVDFDFDFSLTAGFGIEHGLEASTYPATFYVKVTPDSSSDQGKYVIRATEDTLYQRFADNCTGMSRPSGVLDEFSGCQWHLDNQSQFGTSPGEDINVLSVWSGGNLGEGITVAVVDDGMHHQHEDLQANVDTSRNHDYTGNHDIYSPFRSHGTAVAGLIAANDNSTGMRGVAPDATIYGYNYLAGQSTANEANAMSRNAATTAISNNSWGPGGTAGPESADSMWEAAVENGITSGYGGKGVLYVWSGGNGAGIGDDSNLDEYNNFYAVTSVCAVNYADTRSRYSEPGVNLWVCAPSDGRGPGIATTENGNRYQDTFGGTSAAAPIVSGVAALIRKANNDLTWRDVKLILAASARKNDTGNSGWEEGADEYGTTGKYNFNPEYGFGVVDAQAAVSLANGWTNAPPLRKSTASSRNTNLSIPDATVPDPANMVTGGPGATQTTELTLGSGVDFIEYIHVDTRFSHTSFRDLEVVLESPADKKSTLVPHFDEEATGRGIPVFALTSWFRFGSAKHLGEDAAGTWKLHITDHYPLDTGSLRSWSITTFGHGITPLAPGIEETHPASGGYTVIWKAPEDTGRSAIAAYDVRHIETSEDETVDANWTVVDNAWTSGDLQYTSSGLDAGVQYDVQVRAVNGETPGESPWSETLTVTPKTDEAPTIETVTPGNGTLTVAWTAPTSSTLGTITVYDLRYGRGSNPSSWTVVDDAWTSGGGNLEYPINPTPALTNGVTYGVQVRAVVGTDDKAWSETRTGVPRTVPGAPTIVSVDPGESGELIVEWSPPSDNGGSDITSYDARHIRSDVSETDKADDDNWTVKIGVVGGTPGDEKYIATGLDNWMEYDVQVRAVNPAGEGAWSDTKTGTPTNTDVKVTLEWETTVVDANENGGSVTLTAVATTDRGEALPSDFFFDATVATADGTATDPDDYAPSSTTTLGFEDDDFTRMEINGQQRYRATMDFSVPIVDDTVDESDETFTAILGLANPDIDNLSLKNGAATVTIKDDEHVPVMLGWNPASVSVNEGSGTVTLNATATTTVNKRPESGFSFQAMVATSAGTATAADDYTHLSTTVTFQQSDSWSAIGSGSDRRYRATKRITVPIINDDADERDEEFTATVEYADPSPPPYLQGGSADVTVTIEDDDLPPVTIEAVTTSAQEDQSLQFRLTRDGITDDPLTVNVRVSETRSMLASGQPTTATFGPGLSTTTLDVDLADDDEDEENSVITVTVRSGSGYRIGTDASATATAMDNDHVPVTISWDQTSISVAERAGTAALKAVATTTKDKAPETGFSFTAEVSYTDGTADSGDYSAGSTSLTFDDGDFERSGQRYRAVRDVTVNITTTDGDEDAETFQATLAYDDTDPLPPYLQGGSATAIVTIIDSDEPLVTITADASTVTEAEDSITFSVARDGDAPSALRVNVDVTGTGGNMLARAGRYTVNFAAGSNSETLTVNLRDDTEDEDDSTVTAEVVNSSGYFPGSPSAAQTTVTDDDHVPVTLSWEESNVTVDEDDGTYIFDALVTTTKDKMPDLGFRVEVTISTADGTAQQPDDYTQVSTTETFVASNFNPVTIGGQDRYQASRPVGVTVENDIEDEPDERFTVTLAYEDTDPDPLPPHLQGRSTTARFTITDDDPVPLVLGWERPEWSVEESDGSVTLKAVRPSPPSTGYRRTVSASTRRWSTSNGSAQPGE